MQRNEGELSLGAIAIPHRFSSCFFNEARRVWVACKVLVLLGAKDVSWGLQGVWEVMFNVLVAPCFCSARMPPWKAAFSPLQTELKESGCGGESSSSRRQPKAAQTCRASHPPSCSRRRERGGAPTPAARHAPGSRESMAVSSAQLCRLSAGSW